MRNWSKSSLPITIQSTGRLFGIGLPLLWLVVVALWGWMLSYGRWTSHEAFVGLTALVVIVPGVWLIFLVQGTHRQQVRITEQGIELRRGKNMRSDTFPTCSAFTLRKGLLAWSVEANGRVERRGLLGLEYGFRRAEMQALTDLLNRLRASQSGAFPRESARTDPFD